MTTNHTCVVVLRETQDEHGYVDVDVVGVFLDSDAANASIEDWENAALSDGENVAGRLEEWTGVSRDDSEWTVSYKPVSSKLRS
jgi:hypothetical protein